MNQQMMIKKRQSMVTFDFEYKFYIILLLYGCCIIFHGHYYQQNVDLQEWSSNLSNLQRNDEQKNNSYKNNDGISKKNDIMLLYSSHYNVTKYKQLVDISMDPFLSTSSSIFPPLTGAWIYGFWGGFCNQYFTFLGIVFLSNDLHLLHHTMPQSNKVQIQQQQQHDNNNNDQNHGQYHHSNQIYIHSLQWKDLYGTNEKLRHEILFDVYHWNTYYPILPKLVSHHSSSSSSSSPTNSTKQKKIQNFFTDVYIHYDERGSKETVVASKINIDSKLGIAPRLIWNATQTTISKNNNIIIKNPTKSMINATNPYPIGFGQSSEVANNRYKHFAKRLYKYYQNKKLGNQQNDHKKMDIEFEQYKLIMKDALRPHPELKQIIDEFKTSIQSHDPLSSYMVLHARIEPDMQKHPLCLEKKVVNITHIIDSMYEQFPDPPSSTLILLLNKKLLEEEVHNIKVNNNTMAKYNLEVVNDMLRNGLWNGQTSVIEAGSKVAIESEHEIYSRYHTIVGGIINFFLSMDASIFVGTEVSSYSTSVVNSRFYRNSVGSKDKNKQKHTKFNYFYTPKGLYAKETIHWFQC